MSKRSCSRKLGTISGEIETNQDEEEGLSLIGKSVRKLRHYAQVFHCHTTNTLLLLVVNTDKASHSFTPTTEDTSRHMQCFGRNFWIHTSRLALTSPSRCDYECKAGIRLQPCRIRLLKSFYTNRDIYLHNVRSSELRRLYSTIVGPSVVRVSDLRLTRPFDDLPCILFCRRLKNQMPRHD